MNKVILIGRLTQEHTKRTTEGGSIVISNSIAVRREIANQQGEYDADFVNIVAFGKTAELLEKWFRKGDRIGVEGRIQTSRYQNAQGENRYQTAIVVEKVEFLQEKREQPTQPAYNDYPYAPQQQAPKQNFANQPNQFDITDDDLPF